MCASPQMGGQQAAGKGENVGEREEGGRKGKEKEEGKKRREKKGEEAQRLPCSGERLASPIKSCVKSWRG